MATVLDHLETLLPEGWQLTHLIRLEVEWQATITDSEYVTVATGVNPFEALVNAGQKALDGKYVGRLFHLERLIDEPSPSTLSLLDALGLRKPKVTITRRL